MNYLGISYDYLNKPLLDESFIPFGVWAGAFLKGADRPFKVALERDNGHVSVFSSFLRGEEYAEANLRYMERYVKFLLWSVGGWRVTICGCAETAETFRSEPPASKPMRQPFRWPPTALGCSFARGK